MKIEKLKYTNGNYFKGPLVFNPDVFLDNRGYFFVSWNELDFNKAFNKPIHFVQDMFSNSTHGVIRGMHYQKDRPQSKLVQVVNGKIFDVIVDLRRNSKSYKKWASVELSQENKKILFIPKGFAHGFLVLSSSAEVLYKVDDFYHKDSERSLIWNDDLINIKWPLEQIQCSIPYISKKDNEALDFEVLEKLGYTF